MKTVNQRLTEYVEFRNFQNEDLRKALLLKSKSQVSNWLNGKEQVPDKYLLMILRQNPEINANWLINGKGKMLNDGSGDTVQEGKFWTPPLSLTDDNLSVKMYSCQDCILRERLIRSQEETIKSLESAISAKDDLIQELQKNAHQDTHQEHGGCMEEQNVKAG